MEKPTFGAGILNNLRSSVTFKLISICFLILILLIPSGMIMSLITERESLRDKAILDVSSKWGYMQIVGGPVLTIPYKAFIKDDEGKVETIIRYAHFLPDDINITGTITTEKRYRGIYIVVLYNARLKVKGRFGSPAIETLDVPRSSYLFGDAFVSLGISDMKGINDAIPVVWNGSQYSFNPGIATRDIFASGASFPVNLGGSTANSFQFDLNLNGSSSLGFLPFGKETNAEISSKWDSPSFEGSFLPDTRTVDANGFSARWKVLHLNRNYPQQGLGAYISQDEAQNAGDSFGVKLLLPVDEYQKTYRSVRYCLMFIIITFLMFFFVEVINRRRIHPIQYLLVGFAICLFYILLLSISEHLSFNTAYLIACVAILALVTLYARHVLKNNLLTVIFSALLAILYGFFYSLLQLEDYALLLGSIGLFVILAVIMYLTRKIDWYEISAGRE